METDDQLLERYYSLTSQERIDLEERINARFQAKLASMTPAEKLELARSIEAAMKYQG